MILAGQLREVITIQRQVVTRDAKYKSTAIRWENLLENVRAHVTTGRGSEQIAGGEYEVSTVRATFRIRNPQLPPGSKPTSLTNKDRILWDGYVWDMLPFRGIGGSGNRFRVLEIPAQRGQGVA